MGKGIRIWLFSLLPVFATIITLIYLSKINVKGPTQPIVWSHRIHAGEDKIPCQYCHAYTAVSSEAGMPSMQKCLGCHNIITGQDANSYFKSNPAGGMQNQIEQQRKYWKEVQAKGVFNGTMKDKDYHYLAQPEPIPWVRVYYLPEHVQFTHKPHIRRGFECKTCHGEVEKMDIVYRAQDLKMGWCINCHEENARNEKELAQLKDCYTCHY